MKQDSPGWIYVGIVTLISLITVFVINAKTEANKLEVCQQVRIRPFVAEFFTGAGINKLANESKLQPPCL